MRLTKISVYGLFGEYDYEIPLFEGVTFIHSPNGLGKSTIMKLTADILRGDLESVRTACFDRIDLLFDNATSIIVENYGQELKVQTSKNELEEEISVADLVKILPCEYIGPERMYLTDADDRLVPALKVYMKKLATDLQAAVADSDIGSIDAPVSKVTDGELDTMIKDCLAKVDFIKQAGISPVFPSGYRFPPSRYEISQYPDDYRRLGFALKAWCDRYYRFAESIVVFKDIINGIFVNKTVEFNEYGYPEARMDASGTVVALEKFSSGEKQILIMFYRILFDAVPGSLVIIDEPEVSLHVSWQQQLGKLFADVARLRNLTEIVTTHAPAVIHDDWDRALEIVNTRK